MQIGPRFVHLRTHSEYSISDSIVRIDSLAKAAKQDGQPAVALTDLGNLFGWIKLYKAARAQGVQPICGVDIGITQPGERQARVILLARNAAGYRALCELISRGWLENAHRGRAELYRDWLAPYANDLIALSGAQYGDVGQALAGGSTAQAIQLARSWQAMFGQNYYIELQRLGTPESEALVQSSVRLAQELGLPVVATHPVQFLTREEFRAHEARVCIAQGEILSDPRRPRPFTSEQYFLSQQEMAERFADLPQALANSVNIARRCSLTMTLGKAYLPQFPTPDGVSLDQYLREQAALGLEQRMLKLFPDAQERAAKQASYSERLSFECDTIIAMGFPGYFLIVADFINWAKANGVPVGPGRGSGAGSLVAFALGITDLDPIPYALLFERFLNPERVSMPDFDIDFCQDNRYKVIDYVRARYGEQAVSQIATFGTMASKAVIRDVGRVLDMGYNFCDQLSKLVPVVQNKPLSLSKAREAEPLLAQREQAEVEVKELLQLAEPLEDLTRNVGMHAGGVLIAPGKLTDFCPLYQAPGTTSVISQFDKDDVEAVGLVKFDFLGLRNLTIIDLAVRVINERYPDLKLDLATLSFDDPKAYQVLKDANTTAIFQVEGDGMKKLLKKLAPDRFEDIIAVLALYRPGPLGSGMVDDFILRKKGQQAIDYFHPDLKATLEPTYGVIVYQEQVMQIAQIIGGYTLGGADLLRRAMGKKKPEEMAQHRGIFVEGAKKKAYGEELANKLFDLMAMFAEYGFNKSHTAAYAVVTYQTAWLKAHYPAEFLAATLSSDMDDTDKVTLFVADCRLNKVKVLPPDINASGFRFQPVDARTIRYGLGAVKGVGEAAVMNIIEQRSDRPFSDLFDFARRIDRRTVNRRAIEALIRAGAFDALDDHRAKLLDHVGRAMDAAEAVAAHAGQSSLFGGEQEQAHVDMEVWSEVPAWGEHQKLKEEKSALGLFLSGHLFTGFQPEVRRFAKTRLADLQPGNALVAGVVSGMRMMNSRRGRMAIVTIDDGTGVIELPIYSELLDQVRALLKDDELLIAQIKAGKDDYSGGLRVQVEKLMDLCSAREEFGKRVVIALNGVAQPVAIRRALMDYRAGTSPVIGAKAPSSGLKVWLTYHNAQGQCDIELGEGWRVRPRAELFSSVQQHLHPRKIDIVY